MKIDVFGSCITRDAFSFETNKYKVNQYIARSSLISAVSKRYSASLPNNNLTSNFKKRSVKYDFNKFFSSYAKSPDSNTIIIDLFDERFDIFNYNNSIFTFSNEYKQSKFDFPINKVSPKEHKNLFKKYIVDIKNLFANYDNVILHKIKPNLKYHDNNIEKNQKLSIHTKFLYDNIDYYFNLLEMYIPNIKTIEIKGYIGDVNHKWGQSPLHYEDMYYHEFNHALNYVLENNKSYYSQKKQFNIELSERTKLQVNIDNKFPTALYLYKNKDIINRKSYTNQKYYLFEDLSPGRYRVKFFIKKDNIIETSVSEYVTIP